MRHENMLLAVIALALLGAFSIPYAVVISVRNQPDPHPIPTRRLDVPANYNPPEREDP